MFPDATYVSMVLRKHMKHPHEEVQVNIILDLLLLDRRVGPAVISSNLLSYYKANVTTALSHSLNRIWPVHLSKSPDAERITTRTITIITRMARKEGFGPQFLDKVGGSDSGNGSKSTSCDD